MKKSILFLMAVLLAAALVFTSCLPPTAADNPAEEANGSNLPNLDGTWIFTYEIQGQPSELAKIVISGTTAKFYENSEDPSPWIAANGTGTAPTTWEYDPDGDCTVSLSGNTITFTDTDGSETATLASDKKSFTMSMNNEDAVFKLQD